MLLRRRPLHFAPLPLRRGHPVDAVSTPVLLESHNLLPDRRSIPNRLVEVEHPQLQLRAVRVAPCRATPLLPLLLGAHEEGWSTHPVQKRR
eukprot:7382028-Prymnesium_polylepis.2